MKSNVLRNFCFLIFVLAFGSLVSAETLSETLCFVGVGKSGSEKKERLILKKYFDEEIQEEIGAFIKKGKGGRALLLYDGDGTSDESLDYELHWLEFSGGKISGKYSLAKPKSASVLGAYMKYKNLTTGREILFSPSGESGEDCVLR